MCRVCTYNVVAWTDECAERSEMRMLETPDWRDRKRGKHVTPEGVITDQPQSLRSESSYQYSHEKAMRTRT